MSITFLNEPDDTTLGQRGPGRDDDEGVFHIPQISKADASPSDGLMLCPRRSLVDGLTPLQNAVGVFYSQSERAFCLVSLFNATSTLLVYLMPKSTLLKKISVVI